MNKSSEQSLQVGRPVAQPVPTVPTLVILQVVGMHISYSGGVCIIEKVRYIEDISVEYTTPSVIIVTVESKRQVVDELVTHHR